MLKIIKNYNHKLSQELVTKANEPEEWYRQEVKKSKHDLSAMAFEKDWK